MELLLPIVSIEQLDPRARTLIWEKIPTDIQDKLVDELPENVRDVTLGAIFEKSEPRIIQKLLPGRVNDIIWTSDNELDYDSLEQHSLLNVAILRERHDLVELLILNGVDINNDIDMYPLETAINIGNVDIINSLLYAGADPNYEGTMLNVTTGHNVNLLHIMVAHGGIVSENLLQSTFEYQLHSLEKEETNKIIASLLNYGIDLGNSDYPYILKLIKNNFDYNMIELFLSHRADPNLVIYPDIYPTELALDRGEFKIAELLFNYGGLVKYPTQYLTRAFINKSPEVFKYLLIQGGNPKHRDEFGASTYTQVQYDRLYVDLIKRYSKY